MNNSMELIAQKREINEKLNRIEDVLSKRELNDEEKAEYRSLQAQYDQLNRNIETANQEAQARSSVKAEDFNIMAALREARANGTRQINLREAITATGLAGKAVETEIQKILEPLYAKSVLSQLGVKWYKGMPMGDISIPVMTKGSVAWQSETGANATDGTSGFGTNVVLKPKRLTAYFEISEQMLMQDTIGVQEAIKRDAINALVDKFEATVLGNAAGTDNQPAGIFNGKTLSNANTFAKVCDIEATVEAANVTGEMKYLLSPKAKASLRSMAKSAKNTQLVLEGGSVDGVPAITTSNVNDGTKGVYAYGNWSNLACASWADLIMKVDDSIAYANGKIRIYVTGYFDAKVLREAAFAFGDTRATD